MRAVAAVQEAGEAKAHDVHIEERQSVAPDVGCDLGNSRELHELDRMALPSCNSCNPRLCGRVFLSPELGQVLDLRLDHLLSQRQGFGGAGHAAFDVHGARHRLDVAGERGLGGQLRHYGAMRHLHG